eukprot:7390274-Prymnesium_polylepis.1
MTTAGPRGRAQRRMCVEPVTSQLSHVQLVRAAPELAMDFGLILYKERVRLRQAVAGPPPHTYPRPLALGRVRVRVTV